MHVPFPRSSSLFLLLACACGGSDDEGTGRSTLEEPATGSDAASQPDSSSSSADGGDSSASPGNPPGAPATTLAEALNPEGIKTDVLRAKLVVEEACRKLATCGAGASEAQCVDSTLSEWSLSALFFAEPCLDAQLDLYACYARVGCETQTGCAEPETVQQRLCSDEQ